MFLILLSAATYFYFNLQYFLLVGKLEEIARPRVWIILLSFAVNYLFFILCSVLEFPLLVNWFMFAFLLFSETLLYTKGNTRSSLFSTLLGIIFGLAVNIFCRSIFAMLTSQPMRNFDNNINNAANLKGFPVIPGFLLAGAALHMMRYPFFVTRFVQILNHPRHQTFLMEIMTGLFFYLFLNLLLYSTPLNDLLLKIWSIKSSLFSVVGLYLAVRYTNRICELDDYREKNRQIRLELEQRQQEEKALRQEASMDTLTGFYNRSCAEEQIAARMEQNIQFSLCFLDLDGLKNVNDSFGHEEGDRYLLAVTEQIRTVCQIDTDALFRYGGDEFLVLFPDIPAHAARERVESIKERLRSRGIQLPYSLSLSYGIVESTEYSDWRDLIQAADKRMYEQKQKSRIARN